MYFVYVLKSLKDGRNYTGITSDIARRLSQHNSGLSGTPSTKYRGPFKIIYQEITKNREEARKREKFLKSGSGREFLESKVPR